MKYRWVRILLWIQYRGGEISSLGNWIVRKSKGARWKFENKHGVYSDGIKRNKTGHKV